MHYLEGLLTSFGVVSSCPLDKFEDDSSFCFRYFFSFFQGWELLVQYVAPWAVISHVSALLP